jgi:hypothetical protein
MTRAVVNPVVGCTDAKLMGFIRSALRKVSSHTNVSEHLDSVRFRKANPTTGRQKWHQRCVLCKLEMPEGVKVYRIKKDGTRWKVKKSAYDVDHINGNPPLIVFSDIPAYAESLFFGKLRVLCWECHRDHGVKKGKK